MNLFHSKNSKAAKSSSKGPSNLHQVSRDPYIDWSIIFSITAVIAIALVSFGFLTFKNAMDRLQADSFSSSATPVKFDSKALSDLLSKFDARTAERTKLEKGYDGPGDPL